MSLNSKIFRCFLVGLSLLIVGCQNQVGGFNLGSNKETPTPPAPPPLEEIEFSPQLRLGSSAYIGSFLRQLFLPIEINDYRRTNLENIFSTIEQNFSDFGGSCELYRTPEEACSRQITFESAPSIVAANSIRMTITMRAVYQILSRSIYDPTLNVALGKAISQIRDLDFNAVNTAMVSGPDETDVQNLLQILHPGVRFQGDTVNALMEVAEPHAESRDQWRWLLLAALSSQLWQAP